MSRKRKAESVEGSQSMQKREQMEQIFDQIREKINELNKELLTIADIKSFSVRKSKLDAGEVLLSWRLKKPDLITGPATQDEDDCWAHAFARALYAVMKQHRSTQALPTAKLLVDQIDERFLTKTKSLPKSIHAAPSLLRDYGYQMVVHFRPKLKLRKENEDFEKFIERRLAIGPVAICFPYVPGFSHFFGNKNIKKDVFRPSVMDFQAMKYENLDNHCAVITGRGVMLIKGELIEFWEIQETRGRCFGDEGFARLECHKGFITEVYECKQSPSLQSSPMQTTDDKHRKKRKDKISETNPRKKDKEVAWLEKERLPKGSSPVVWDSAKYTSSSEEEFEGFFHKDYLLMSDADKSSKKKDVLDFFKDFECTVDSREVDKDKKVTYTVKFSSAESAVKALEDLKDVKFMGQTVSLTRSVNSMYKSFCIKGFKKNLDISKQVNDKFGVFGKILHILFPLKEEDFVYLYMALKPEVTVESVLRVKNLHVRECQMKGKVTKGLSLRI